MQGMISVQQALEQGLIRAARQRIAANNDFLTLTPNSPEVVLRPGDTLWLTGDNFEIEMTSRESRAFCPRFKESDFQGSR